MGPNSKSAGFMLGSSGFLRSAVLVGGDSWQNGHTDERKREMLLAEV